MNPLHDHTDLLKPLCQLVKINADRIRSYENAHATLKDNADLKNIFKERMLQSENFISDLNIFIKNTGGLFSEEEKLREVMDVQPISVLASCQLQEAISIEAYDEFLSSPINMSSEIRHAMLDQQSDIRKSHDFIKKFCDFNLELTA